MVSDFLAGIDATAAEASATGGDVGEVGERLAEASGCATRGDSVVVAARRRRFRQRPRRSGAVSADGRPGHGGWLLTKSAIAAAGLLAGDHDGFSSEFLEQKLVTARFYATQLLPQAAGLLSAVTAGPADLFAATF